MHPALSSLRERVRAELEKRGLGERSAAIILALIIEALIALLFLYMTPAFHKKEEPKVVVFGIQAEGDNAESKSDNKQQKAKPKGGASAKTDASKPIPVPTPVPPPPVETKPQQNNFIRLSRSDMAASDLSRGASTAPTGNSNSPDTGETGFAAGDSEVVGKGPNGEPLYAAEWYREPTDAELRSDLVTGSGWGMIACRTAPNYRVEDCQEIGQSPRGSRLASAVRNAAFQFRVRPPRKGGQKLIGAWVRIRIDYHITTVRSRGGRSDDDSTPPPFPIDR